jgi:type II secretory pathway component PulF
MQTQASFSISQFFKSRTGLVLLAFLAIAAFYLITEHTAHLFGILPYALLLLCPFLHLFMHGGHGDHHAQSGQADHAGHDQRNDNANVRGQTPQGGSNG